MCAEQKAQQKNTVIRTTYIMNTLPITVSTRSVFRLTYAFNLSINNNSEALLIV